MINKKFGILIIILLIFSPLLIGSNPPANTYFNEFYSNHSIIIFDENSSVVVAVYSPANFTIDGINYSGYTVLNKTIGSLLNITCVNWTYTQNGNSCNRTFHHWEDTLGFYSENQSINYTISNKNSTLIAVYIPDFKLYYEDGYPTWDLNFDYLPLNDVHFNNLIGIEDFDFNGTFLYADDAFINVSDPYSPIQYSQRSDGHRTDCFNVELNKHYLFSMYQDVSGTPGENYIFLSYDISDVEHPSRLGNITLGGLSQYVHTALNNQCCYVYGVSHPHTAPYLLNLTVINVTDPINMKIENHYNFFDGSCGIYRVDDVVSHCFYDNYLYLFFGEGIIVIFNISKPTEPTLVDHIDTYATIQDAYISDEVLYVAVRNKGLQIYNISIPFLPSPITIYNATLEDCWDVYSVGKTIFVADGQNGLHVLNGIDLKNISDVFSYLGTDLMSCVWYYNDYVYAGDYLGTISVYKFNETTGLELLNVKYTGYSGFTNLFKFSLGLLGHQSTQAEGGYAFQIGLNYVIPDKLGKLTHISSGVAIDTLSFYKDNNGDGKLGIFYAKPPNNPDYLITCYTADDHYIGKTIFIEKGVEIIPHKTMAWRANNVSYFLLNITFNNVSIYEYITGNILGKVNCTYNFLVGLNLTYNAFDPIIKMSFNFIPYNLSSELAGNFSAASGYTMYTDTFFNFTSNMGHFDYAGRPTLGLEMEKDYTITHDNISVVKQTNFSYSLSGRSIIYPKCTDFLANFVNISEGDTVYYDPKAIMTGATVPIQYESKTEIEINYPPHSNQPGDLTLYQNSTAFIDWILTDDKGQGFYRVFINNSPTLWDMWINNTSIHFAINSGIIGIYNYTIIYNDSLGLFGIASTVFITIISHPSQPSPEVPGFSLAITILMIIPFIFLRKNRKKSF